MKQYIYVIFLVITLLTFFSSCENKGNKEFLDDYDSILYFLNDSEQRQALYRVGEPTTVSINITKAGSNLGAKVSADIEVMTQSELDEYNVSNGTQFIILPQDCYKITSNPRLNFTSSDTYLLFDILYETAKIDLLKGTNYVLPLKLISETTVNLDKNIVLIRPFVEDALVFFDNTGTNRITIDDGAKGLLKYEIAVKHNFNNIWDFNATVGINKSLLEEFNTANGVNYLMAPDEAYEITKDGRVEFQANVNYGNLDLAIDGSKISYGNYLLPLSILAVSKNEFKIDPTRKDNVYILTYAPAEAKLSPISLTVDMLSSNAVEPNEGSLANLLDGDITTYFHSAYSVAVIGDHYLQINLKEEISAFNFQFSTRHNNSGGNPASIILQGSKDGVKFFNIETIEENLPTTTSQEYKSPVIVTDKTKYLRLVVPANRSGTKHFVMSEFSMKGLK